MTPIAGDVGLRVGRRAMSCLLVGLLLLSAATEDAPRARAGQVVGRLGTITVTATSLTPGHSDALTSDVLITTSGAASDQLDAALAAGDTAVAVYHQQVSVGEIFDLASCDGERPSQLTVEQWLHQGPLVVPGRAYDPASPANATLTIPAAGISTSRKLAVTFYFAHSGQLTLNLPVR